MIFSLPIAGIFVLWILFAVRLKCFSKFGREMTWRYAFFKIFCIVVCVFLYRRKTVGAKFVPEKGGCIVIANHTSYADVICMGLASPRPVRYVSWAGFEDHFLTKIFMRAMRTIPIAPDKAKDGMKTAVAALKSGELICIFPEGSMTRNGSMQAFLGGVQLIARTADVPVVPAYIDGLWGSFTSFPERNFFFKKIPRISLTPVAIAFGEPFKMGKRPGEKTLREARAAVLSLGEKLFSERRELRRHLARVLVSACSRHPFRTAVVDHSLGRKKMSNAMLLAVSRCLSLRISEKVRERRIGIVLPPGIAGMLANYACTLCGKIPVNLNFTLGRAQMEACLATAKIETIVSVAAMKKQLADKFPDFPWMESQIDILGEIKSIPKTKILLALAQTIFLPAFLVKILWRVPANGGDEEASILFTSGSSGTPKAAVFTHKNVIANCIQIDDYDILPAKTRLLCNLPIFHCFGYTTLLWFAGTRDILAVTTPSPLDFARSLQAVREEKVSVMLSTPTFLRVFLRKAPPEYLASLNFVIAGAEKTPEGFAAAWEEKFPNTHYLEGYGMTEASPIVSANKPDVVDESRDIFQRGEKSGSVGILFPGMCAEVRDPERGNVLDENQSGMLFLKGANIISGYLDGNENRVPATEPDGWYKTGDIVSMDAAGFISIQGRLARFSKIGGEMVPHGSVEDAISALLCLDVETRQVAVTGRPDANKGEVLVLVTTLRGIDVNAIGKRLAANGFPNLWIPREIKIVPEIPVLGTGKLDIKSLADLVKDA